jgi:hypothetical protein
VTVRVTVRVTGGDVIEPEVAVIVLVPLAAPVARPWEPAVLEMVAAVPDAIQVTAEVRSWVVPSLNVPTALNCTVVPTGIVGLDGVTFRLANTGCGGSQVTAMTPTAVAPNVSNLGFGGPANWMLTR